MCRSSFSAISLRMSVVIFSFTLVSCMFSGNAGAGESNVYAAVSSFTWKEFDDNGARLVKESGELYGIGFAYRSISSDKITLQPGAEFFGGTVNYDGTAQNLFTGTTLPAKSTVDYFGVKLKIEAGGLLPLSESSSLGPFFGLGIAAWSRTIKNATVSDGTTASGAEEKWRTVHLRLGLRGQIAESERTRFFAEAGVKLPVYTENVARVTVHPGNEPSYFSEAGVQLGSFRASVFYDGMRFSRSSPVSSTEYYSGSYYHVNYVQPRSTSDIFGLKLGGVF